MLNVLIDAYAISPNWGSEQGMGWNWVSNLAKFCNLYVITEGEWKKEIEQSLDAAMHNNLDKAVNPTNIMGASKRICDSGRIGMWCVFTVFYF